MANDAKLGLVLGVTIVLIIALVFFRQDTLVAKTSTNPSRPTTALPKAIPSEPLPPQVATLPPVP